MKIIEVTQQTNEGPLQWGKDLITRTSIAARKAVGSNSAKGDRKVFVLTSELGSRYVELLKQGGTAKNKGTAHDLAEFLLKTGIDSESVKAAILKIVPSAQEEPTAESSQIFEFDANNIGEIVLTPKQTRAIMQNAVEAASRTVGLDMLTVPKTLSRPGETAKSLLANPDNDTNQPDPGEPGYQPDLKGFGDPEQPEQPAQQEPPVGPENIKKWAQTIANLNKVDKATLSGELRRIQADRDSKNQAIRDKNKATIKQNTDILNKKNSK